VFAVQYSPFTCILPACIAAYLLGNKAGLWIFDLWPQSVSTLLRPSLFSKVAYSLIESFVSVVYAPFSFFFVSSPAFMRLSPVTRLKDVQLLYSWEPKDVLPRLGSNPLDLAGPIRLISIGNLGSAHDLDLVEEFLLLTDSLNITWSFIGGGSGISRLRSFCFFHGLSSVTFHGFLPKKDCLELCSQADFSIVPFKDSPISDTICYRFVSSLSVATPIISFGENAISELVRSSSCGFVLAQSSSPCFQSTRDELVFDSLSDLAESLCCRLAFVRSSCRDLALELFNSRFSESAAEASLRATFFDS
jgi:glycosyltransferase involved in cell wall biosynthesis